MELVLGKGKRNHKFYNRTGTVMCKPELYFCPSVVDDIRQIIGVALVNKRRIRITGNDKYIDELSSTTDYLISMGRLDQIIRIDTQRNTITVQTGIKLSNLESYLNQHGLSLPVFPLSLDMCLCTALLSGVYGSGLKYSILSSYILELELVTYTGEIVTLSREHNPCLFLSACVNLGALGVVAQVTLQCRAKVDIITVSYGLELKDLLESLEIHLNASDHFYFHWYPHTNQAILHHGQYKQRSEVTQIRKRRYWNGLVERFLLWVLRRFSQVLSFTRTWPNRFAYYMRSRRSPVLNNEHSQWNDGLQSYHMEWSLPRNKTALALFEIQQWMARNHYTVAFPVRVAFVQSDDLPLSPAYNMDSCCIAIPHSRVDRDSNDDPLISACVNIMKLIGGNPILAKMTRRQRSECDFRNPGQDQFLKHSRTTDPEVMFWNTYADKIFNTDVI